MTNWLSPNPFGGSRASNPDVEYGEDLFRSYGPGKFDTYATAYLYNLAMDGADEETGDVQGPGYYSLLRGPFEHPQLVEYAGAILYENDQGFVYSDLYENGAELEREWKKVEKHVESFYGDEED